ncbi:hypothetical protein, conserved [Trypanosoma brucei gambiense DAL972]|uniref:Uncharacterized protein n=2 Tax=Trypanosoma brucei TaxID=5691 RepID=D0A317_TRYB9|nr:hypothetical protein, conserved [Trypanosoma brucei gambiense DAL972]CBH15661.1 hypothetical protein, conserved [Trypanosoma brucei gambiense DAL972]|eukprot:XP_011777925.1 hypothetical protein, conserved [Trypanosoma brucei gambiense DAL972]
MNNGGPYNGYPLMRSGCGTSKQRKNGPPERAATGGVEIAGGGDWLNIVSQTSYQRAILSRSSAQSNDVGGSTPQQGTSTCERSHKDAVSGSNSTFTRADPAAVAFPPLAVGSTSKSSFQSTERCAAVPVDISCPLPIDFLWPRAFFGRMHVATGGAAASRRDTHGMGPPAVGMEDMSSGCSLKENATKGGSVAVRETQLSSPSIDDSSTMNSLQAPYPVDWTPTLGDDLAAPGERGFRELRGLLGAVFRECCPKLFSSLRVPHYFMEKGVLDDAKLRQHRGGRRQEAELSERDMIPLPLLNEINNVVDERDRSPKYTMTSQSDSSDLLDHKTAVFRDPSSLQNAPQEGQNEEDPAQIFAGLLHQLAVAGNDSSATDGVSVSFTLGNNGDSVQDSATGGEGTFSPQWLRSYSYR